MTEKLRKVLERVRTRSYTKARVALKRGRGCYCIEGAICEEYRKTHRNAYWENRLGRWYFVDAKYNSSDITLPADVLRWLGFEGAEYLKLGFEPLNSWNDSTYNLGIPEMASHLLEHLDQIAGNRTQAEVK